MDCPHRDKRATYCHLVEIGVPAKHDPCGRCQSEWIDGRVPTLETLTPTLAELKSRIDGTKVIPKTEIKIPPLWVRMKNFATAAAKHIAAGAPVLDKPETDARLAVCDGCQYRVSVMGRRACGICGCDLSVKASWADQQCPKLYWPGDKEKTPCGKPCGS